MGRTGSTSRRDTSRSPGRYPLVRRSVAQEVADHMRELIYQGDLRAGEKVPQDELAEELGVSRLPVRQAIAILENEGLVRSEPHRGAFVAAIQRRDLEDHYEIFGLVSGLSARRAALSVDEETIKALEDINERLRGAAGDDAHDLDWEFHRIVNEAGDSRRARLMLRTLGNTIPWSFFSAVPMVDSLLASHDRLIEALRARDPEAAARATLDHFREEGRMLTEILEQRGLWADESGGTDDRP